MHFGLNNKRGLVLGLTQKCDTITTPKEVDRKLDMIFRQKPASFNGNSATDQSSGVLALLRQKHEKANWKGVGKAFVKSQA